MLLTACQIRTVHSASNCHTPCLSWRGGPSVLGMFLDLHSSLDRSVILVLESLHLQPEHLSQRGYTASTFSLQAQPLPAPQAVTCYCCPHLSAWHCIRSMHLYIRQQSSNQALPRRLTASNFLNYPSWHEADTRLDTPTKLSPSDCHARASLTLILCISSLQYSFSRRN